MNEFKAGVKAAVPTAMGYISIGIALGIVGAAAGLKAWQMGLMSLMVYAGSAQFALVAMMAAGADILTMTATVFLINLRNMLMSLHATTLFPGLSLGQGLAIGSLITDESYGVLMGRAVHEKTISPSWMHGNNIFSYLVWIVSTILGTILGSLIPSPEKFGLDFALIAMFIGLLVFQLEAMLSLGAKKLLLILGAVAISYVALAMVVTDSLAVLLATLIGCGLGVLVDRE